MASELGAFISTSVGFKSMAKSANDWVSAANSAVALFALSAGKTVISEESD